MHIINEQHTTQAFRSDCVFIYRLTNDDNRMSQVKYYIPQHTAKATFHLTDVIKVT